MLAGVHVADRLFYSLFIFALQLPLKPNKRERAQKQPLADAAGWRNAHLCNLVLQNTARVSLKTATNITNKDTQLATAAVTTWTHTVCRGTNERSVLVYHSFAVLESCAQN